MADAEKRKMLLEPIIAASGALKQRCRPHSFVGRGGGGHISLRVRHEPW